ncbi:MFS transporter [Actinomadura violacea]|uniref:MFS transporter n=1 Tax=Actinomadura violacea TaxID=2819934 RepID=A0ABS3RVT8_9ACTN|nr:MFS transporter [Actinomadura violacea]MBO2460865.1 MFS transporter [Actinomadura violacea]
MTTSTADGTATSTTAPTASAGAAGRGVIALLAVACGVAVGNVYFPQAAAPAVAAGLGVGAGTAAGVVSAAQFGYAAGIFLLVPLGDRVPHRRLIVALLAVTAAALAVAGAAPDAGVLLAASAAAGAATVVAPVIGPMAAGLVPADRRGLVSGVMLSGSLGGMLLSRSLGGPLAQWLGWRSPYLVAAALALVLAVVLWRALPVTAPPSGHPYRRLLLEPLALLRQEPLLRRSCFYQAAVFGAFSAVWTGVALLLSGPRYELGAPAVGALALVNAATMLCTPVAGRAADRRGPDAVNLWAMIGVLVSAGVLAVGCAGGAPGLVALAAGSLLLDVAMQSGMVANQVRNYALRADARSRVNTAYMTCGYLGGAAGSWLAARVYGGLGWAGVCALAGTLAASALARHMAAMRRHRRRGGPARPAADATDAADVTVDAAGAGA